jgi:hypothetical protein
MAISNASSPNFVEQRPRIGFFGARLGALRDQPGKVVERKHFIHGDNAMIALCRSKRQFVEGGSGRCDPSGPRDRREAHVGLVGATGGEPSRRYRYVHSLDL